MSIEKRKVIYSFLLIFLTVVFLNGQNNSNSTGKRSQPCTEKTESGQFNFWLGEWDVTIQGEKIADSRISSIEGNCIILEQYSQSDGYTGESFNFYNPISGKWRQVWVDKEHNISEFSGEYHDNAIYYEGATYSSNGIKVLRKMTLFNLGPDKVRQLSQRSTDNGKTWNVNYDFLYVRKK